MQERIKQLMEYHGLTASELAAKLGVGKPVISHILSGRNNPSVMVLEKIAEQFEGLSLNWLITGKGDMHLPGVPNGAQPDMPAHRHLQDEDPAPYAPPYPKAGEKSRQHETGYQPHRPQGNETGKTTEAPLASAQENVAKVSKIIVVGADGSVSLFSQDKL